MTFSQVKPFATAHGVTYYKIGPIYGTIAPKLLTISCIGDEGFLLTQENNRGVSRNMNPFSASQFNQAPPYFPSGTKLILQTDVYGAVRAAWQFQSVDTSPIKLLLEPR